MTPVWASEIVPYCIAISKQHFPEMKHLGNIRNVDGRMISPVHVITFSSPCQNLSIAGNRRGIQHEDYGSETTTESGLFYEAVRIIKEMRESTNGEYPKYAIWENVTGAFQSNDGRDFYTVLREIVALCDPRSYVPEPDQRKGKYIWRNAGLIEGNGWSVAWRVLDAQHYTPQRRQRIFLVIDFGGNRASEILFEQAGMSGNAQQSAEEREGSSSAANGSNHGSAGFLANQGSRARSIGYEHDKCPSLMSSNAGNSVPAVVYDCRGYGDGNIVPPITGDHNCRVTDYTAVCVGNGQIHQMSMSNICSTLDCMHDQKSVLITNGRNHTLRRLMPVECARLQGMPDDWGYLEPFPDFDNGNLQFWINVRNEWARINGKKQRSYNSEQMGRWYHSLHSDTSEYRMYGNGICLPCAEYILKKIAYIIGKDSIKDDSDQIRNL